jgi:hypothetical protein
MKLLKEHYKELLEVKLLLENPGLAAKLTNYVGSPIDKLFKNLPSKWNEKVSKATEKALFKAVQVAIFTLKNQKFKKSHITYHRLGVGITGGVGGFFGIYALLLELPFSTVIMLRSILDIARFEGESLKDSQTIIGCMEVFALGGVSKNDNATESGYFMVRASLAKSITEVTEYIASKTVVEEGAPVILRFITAIAQRFGIQITEKAVAQSFPFIGAFGGALINTVFISHFQQMARGHFKIRKLERIYGQEIIQNYYEKISLDEQQSH